MNLGSGPGISNQGAILLGLTTSYVHLNYYYETWKSEDHLSLSSEVEPRIHSVLPQNSLFQFITIAFSCSRMRAASDGALGDKLSKMRTLSGPAAHKDGRRVQRSDVSKLTDGISCQSSP